MSFVFILIPSGIAETASLEVCRRATWSALPARAQEQVRIAQAGAKDDYATGLGELEYQEAAFR
jgi:hypothetical protein